MAKELLEITGSLIVLFLVSEWIRYRRGENASDVKRPRLVWVIAAYYWILGPFRLMWLYTWASSQGDDAARLTKAQRAYWTSIHMSSFDLGSELVVIYGSMIGAVYLLWLKRESVLIFLGVFVFIFLENVGLWYQYGLQAQPAGLVGIGINIAIVIYAYRLRRIGVLR